MHNKKLGANQSVGFQLFIVGICIRTVLFFDHNLFCILGIAVDHHIGEVSRAEDG